MSDSSHASRPPQQAAKSHSLATPDRVDLEDIEVGSYVIDPIQIYNIDPEHRDGPVTVRYLGDPSIQLYSTPSYFRPTTQDTFNNDENATKLLFMPSHEGHVSGTLAVSFDSQAPIEIPIQGAAHLPGSPSLAQQDTERDQAEHDAAAAKEREERAARLDADYERHKHDHKHHGDNYIDDKNRFDDAKDNAQLALAKLYELRRVGATTARAEASKFSREQPEHEVSLAMELGIFALNFATEGIAAVVSKRLEGLLDKKLTTRTAVRTPNGYKPEKVLSSAPKDVVQFFSNGVKDELKAGAKPHIAQLANHKGIPPGPGRGTEPRDTPLSSDPVLGFFGTEETSLVLQNADVAKRVVLGAYRSLLPLLDAQPEAATAALQLCADGLEAEAENARDIQADASSRNWVRFVAQSSLGDVAPDAASGRLHADRDGLTLTDITAANSTPTEKGESTSFDGLVDVGFQVDINHPEKPVTVHEAHIHGVSKSTAYRIGKEPLLGQRLAVRAYGMPTPDAEVVPIAVVRDEAGNIQYSDETSVGGMAKAKLARAEGRPCARDTSRGARGSANANRRGNHGCPASR